jgi:hypothetical protein
VGGELAQAKQPRRYAWRQRARGPWAQADIGQLNRFALAHSNGNIFCNGHDGASMAGFGDPIRQGVAAKSFTAGRFDLPVSEAGPFLIPRVHYLSQL